MEPKPKQSDLTFEPKYEEYDGVKHEWTGMLYVPAPGESERLEREKPPDTTGVLPVTVTMPPTGSHYHGFSENTTLAKKVKMKMLDALRLRNLQPPR